MDRFIVLLNGTGDVCISWEPDQDVELLTFIQKKIDSGYIFFVTDRKFFNLVKRKKAIGNINEIGTDRKVYLDDESAELLAKENKISISKIETTEIKTISKAKTAQEVVSAGAAVAIRPARGG